MKVVGVAVGGSLGESGVSLSATQSPVSVRRASEGWDQASGSCKQVAMVLGKIDSWGCGAVETSEWRAALAAKGVTRKPAGGGVTCSKYDTTVYSTLQSVRILQDCTSTSRYLHLLICGADSQRSNRKRTRTRSTRAQIATTRGAVPLARALHCCTFCTASTRVTRVPIKVEASGSERNCDQAESHLNLSHRRATSAQHTAKRRQNNLLFAKRTAIPHSMGRSLFVSTPTRSAASPPPAPDVEALSRLLYPHDRALRARVFSLLKEDVFRLRFNETVCMERERTNARVNRLHELGLLRNSIALANEAGSRRYDAVIDVLALLDHSLEVKLGVNFGLFSATLRRLGSKEQYEYWLPRIEAGTEVGCFALTELGHGSNVRGIQTTAKYLPQTDDFEIHTPHDLAQKYWIGAAAESANVSVVFAQLEVRGVQQGIHVFIVPLRNKDDRSLLSGITIADCGPKAGLNGVDNGRIWFDRVRVPRANMLTGMSSVSSTGEYTSRIASPDARFGAQLAALTGGRVGIAFNAVESALLGLTIAIRYSAVRRAFAPSKGAREVPLLFYTSQQRLLMVPLATAFVYAFCARDLREMYYKSISTGSVPKELHSLSAGYKAMFSWFMQDTLQKTREACGGQGYKSDNRIAPLKADRDVMLTFEGANGVMLQQVAKVLLAELAVAAKNGGKYAKDSVVEALNTPPTELGSSKKMDKDFVASTLWQRENKLVQQLGRRYASMMQAFKGSSFHAWNECLSLAETAATAHMHRRMYDAHQVHLKAAFAADEGCGEALKLCGQLWAADVIASDPAFLRLECLSPAQANDVLERINGFCRKMTGIAEPLLQGVGYPDHILAPIAVDFVEYNSRAKL